MPSSSSVLPTQVNRFAIVRPLANGLADLARRRGGRGFGGLFRCAGGLRPGRCSGPARRTVGCSLVPRGGWSPRCRLGWGTASAATASRRRRPADIRTPLPQRQEERGAHHDAERQPGKQDPGPASPTAPALRRIGGGFRVDRAALLGVAPGRFQPRSFQASPIKLMRSALQLADRSPDMAARQAVGAGDVAAQRVLSHTAFTSPDAAGIAIDPPQCPPSEVRVDTGPGHLGAVLDVGIGFGA